MKHRALDSPHQRALLIAAFGVTAALLGPGLWLTSCTSLPSALCAKCDLSCPGDLECKEKRCVRPEHADDCSEPGVSVTTDAVTSNGSGGGGGERDDGGDAEGAGGLATTVVTTGAGGADACAAEHPPCEPEFVTPRVLPAVCSGSQLRVELEAGCKCDETDSFHSVSWSADELPPGLTLEPSGLLVGDLPDGTHQLRFSASVDGKHITDEFEVSVLDRCLVFFATPEATTGQPILAAARIDSGDPVALGTDPAEGADLVRFDVSPNGRFLAEVERIEGREVCRLFGVGATQVEPIALEYEGDYLEHAFSRDSRWLALVTSPAGEAISRQIELVDLHDDPTRVMDVAEIDYQGGLTWSDAGGLLYRDSWSENPLYLTARELAVNPSGFDSEEEYGETREMNDNRFYRFFVSDAGFMMLYQSSLPFYERTSGEVVRHPPVQALSPDLRWVAQLDSKGVWVTPVATPTNLSTRRAGCDVVRAWSRDGSKLLCTLNHQLMVYDVVGDGELERTLLTDILDGDVRRAAFSDTGRWLALTPSDAGFVVLSEDEFAEKPLDQATLEPPSGKNEWDYFFTPDQTRLVVQRGRDVLVAALESKSSVAKEDFHDLGVTLREVPACSAGWFPDPDQWCGAPRWRGNVRLAPAARHIAFTSLEGVGQVASLDTLRVVSMGPVSDLASSDSIVLQ